MPTGPITQYIDVAQIALYAFWVFFAGLIYYLRREDKREGYPLESDRSGSIRVQGWPAVPPPKTFLLRDGSMRVAPRAAEPVEEVRATAGRFPGAPLEPTGNPMLDGVGPAAYANRPHVPDLTLDGQIKIVPLRVAHDYAMLGNLGARHYRAKSFRNGKAGGVVRDVWVDRSAGQALQRLVQRLGRVVQSAGSVQRRNVRVNLKSHSKTLLEWLWGIPTPYLSCTAAGSSLPPRQFVYRGPSFAAHPLRRRGPLRLLGHLLSFASFIPSWRFREECQAGFCAAFATPATLEAG